MTITADDLIKALASKAAAAVDSPGAPAPAPAAKKGSVLVSPDTVQGVFSERLFAIAQQMGLDPSDPRVKAEADKQTKTKVGDLNFANWHKANDAEADEARAETEAEKAEAAKPVPPPIMPDVAGEYLQDAQAITKRVEALNRKLNELDTGHGAKGAAARLTIGAMGVGSAVVGAIDAGKTATEVPMDHVNSALLGGTPDKHKETVEKAKAAKAELITTVKVALGDAQAMFDKTRPAYTKFGAARDHFYAARKTYLDTEGQLSDRNTNAMAGMRTSVDDMKAAEAELESVVSGLPVDDMLKRIDAWNKSVEGTAATTLNLGVEVMGGELMAGEDAALGKSEEEAGKNLTSEELEEAEKKGQKLVEHPIRDKAVDYVKDMPKEKVKDLPKDLVEDEAKRGVKNAVKGGGGDGKEKKKAEG